MNRTATVLLLSTAVIVPAAGAAARQAQTADAAPEADFQKTTQRVYLSAAQPSSIGVHVQPQ
jgi:hypothetical protein